jgi:tetratricopeptide (TPR) repeat protein
MVMLAAKFVLAASIALPLAAQSVSAQSGSDDMAAHAQAARAAQQRGDFSTAAHEYEFLVQKLPRSAEIQSNLGVALYFDHQWEHAIAAFRKANALNPNLLAPHLFGGLAWYQLSRPDTAVPELETAVRLRSSDVIAHTWLGYAYVAQSKYDAAAKQFEEVCRLAPDNIDAWYALGQAYLQIGKDSTVELLRAAPNGGRAWQLAGEQYALRGDRKKALVDFEQANTRRPDIAELRTAVTEPGGTPSPATPPPGAEAAREDAIYARAHAAEQKSRAAFEHVLSIAPDSYRAHQIMADAFVLEQQEDKAIAEYRIVLNLKPDLPGIHEAIGSSLLRSGKSAEALTEFQSELQLQPRSAAVNTLLGQTLLLLGKDDDAEKVLKDALLMDRPPPDAYRLLGKLDLRRNAYRAAVDHLSRYLSIEKNDATAYYLLSRAYRGLGEKEQMNQALAQFEKVSQDVKARSHAQGELERLDNQNHVDEGMVRDTPASTSP